MVQHCLEALKYIMDWEGGSKPQTIKYDFLLSSKVASVCSSQIVKWKYESYTFSITVFKDE